MRALQMTTDTISHVSSLLTENNNSERNTRKILCLHGWLDNAASFNRFAPSLIESLSSMNEPQQPNSHIKVTELVALDFPGHGLSGHKSADGPPQLLAEYAYYVAECVEALKWGSAGSSGDQATDKITVIGHSMGGKFQMSRSCNIIIVFYT